MKKTFLLLSYLFIAFISLQGQPSFLGLTEQGAGFGSISKYDAATNTISLVHGFQINAATPRGKMVKAANGLFFGMTSAGGASNAGVIFSFDPANSNYTVVKTFNNSDGANPNGSLIYASNGKFYGMTANGGTFGRGVIFSFDPLSHEYIVIKNFDLPQGGNPWGSLIQSSDGKLYGMTLHGGTSNTGALFSFDINTSFYTVLKNFNSVDGTYPYGSLIEASDGKLYGMTREGGAMGYGVIFSYDRSLANYAVVKSFENTDGAYPVTSLMQASDGKLYGTTVAGGSGSLGVVFSFNMATSSYTLLKSLSYYDGTNPYSSLIQASNGKLYGMTWTGGSSNSGVIFSFDLLTSTYTVAKNFDATNGGNPQFNDLQTNTDGKLYGTTYGRSTDERGVIFSFDVSTSAYNKLRDFGDDNALAPQGTLCKASNGKYYGMTREGGTSNKGVIFSYDRATSSYAVVKNFNGNDGANPAGSLIQASNGKLYGMTLNGGTSDAGVIFSFDPLSSTYTALKSFTVPTGAHPFGSLIEASGGKLYGMTHQGGSFAYTYNDGYGVIFSFDPNTLTYSVLKNFELHDGGKPYGSLMQANDGKLYGMTSQGGIVDPPITYVGNPPPIVMDPLNLHGNGVIFSFEPSSSTYTVVKFFESYYGANPFGSLIQAKNGKLYGMTNRGGSSKSYPYYYDGSGVIVPDFGLGVIFSFDLPTSNYSVLKDFSYSTGSNPYGSLIQATDNKLYGMTTSGGASSAGVVFSLDPNTLAYTKKDFQRGDGSSPRFSDLLEIKVEQINCPVEKTVNADEGSCTAIINNIDPHISPAGSAVTYTLTGATSGNGIGSASGLQFNVGTTTVLYTAPDDPTKTCSFTVTVNPTSVFYQDADGDGFGNVAVKKYACTQPAGYVTDNTDCSDNDASVHAAITYYQDADNDGFGNASVASTLCQATPPSGYVTNNSDCNDNQKLYQDVDGDGYGSIILVACGGVTNNTDCDDTKTTSHPGATEICNNGIDDNCNGQIDEGCMVGLPSITITDVSVYESNGQALLTVSLSNVGASDIMIGYATSDGTATSSVPKGKKGVVADYVATSGNIIIPAGTLSATIRININADNVIESAENFSVNLSLNKANAKKATISDGTAVVTILNGSANRVSTNEKEIAAFSQKLTVKALPNPSATYFTLVTQSTSTQSISIVVYDLLGRVVESKSGLSPNQSVSLGHNYKQGLYYAEIIQGNQKQTIKLIKGAK